MKTNRLLSVLFLLLISVTTIARDNISRDEALNIIKERLSKNNKHKSKDIKTRARVLNDFNKYLTILLKNQPRFNFSEYYEASPFYHNSIEIDKNTVKYTTDLLRSMLLI